MMALGSSATAAAAGQLQRQVAQRMAEQYEARAASLRAQARSAEVQADRASQQAVSFNVQADQAQGRADTVKTTVAASDRMGQALRTQSAQTVQALQRATRTEPTAAAPTPTEFTTRVIAPPSALAVGGGVAGAGLLNLQGQRIGARVDVTV